MGDFQLTSPEPVVRKTRAISASSLPCHEREALEEKYRDLIIVNPDLSRQLVSFQANKETPFYRWFKYKEGFSEPMVSYFLDQLSPKPGRLLDPFAGAGSALFAARSRGWDVTGIELLPVGILAMNARLSEERVTARQFEAAVFKVKSGAWKAFEDETRGFHHVTITRGAFSLETELQLDAYLRFCDKSIRNLDVRTLLRFAAFSILESISFTRKDGQYLRWDHRSGRSLASKSFDKGLILPFEVALYRQLDLMLEDITAPWGNLFSRPVVSSSDNQTRLVNLLQDSCLLALSGFTDKSFDFILTSPPYCNRYDYTRTYALELAFLGTTEEGFRNLRQGLLSCTVENRAKIESLGQYYNSRGAGALFASALRAFNDQRALQEILCILDDLREQDQLNNPGIARMVRNYFLEMSLVIHECARLLTPGGYFVMVNDNVSYNGEDVPVDLILSELAVLAGLEVSVIWKLGKGKGNSSQQMGRHGRREQRKCVYVWRRPKATAAS